ncbi:ATP-binding protein, partial [Flavobacteriaceae bacterium]|nr:ATP-binding protein [Flavobacteriaceae bacterium]
RINQYLDSVKIENENVFFDRGIPDIVAYLDFKHMKYNQKYIDACENHKYDLVFILRPWKEIFVNDKQRYESFEESLEIDKFIYKTYKNLKYNIVEIPKISIKERMNFIIDKINII